MSHTFKFEFDDGREFEYQNCYSFTQALSLLEGDLGGRDRTGNLPDAKHCERVYVDGHLAKLGDHRRLDEL